MSATQQDIQNLQTNMINMGNNLQTNMINMGNNLQNNQNGLQNQIKDLEKLLTPLGDGDSSAIEALESRVSAQESLDTATPKPYEPAFPMYRKEGDFLVYDKMEPVRLSPDSRFLALERKFRPLLLKALKGQLVEGTDDYNHFYVSSPNSVYGPAQYGPTALFSEMYDMLVYMFMSTGLDHTQFTTLDDMVANQSTFKDACLSHINAYCGGRTSIVGFGTLFMKLTCYGWAHRDLFMDLERLNMSITDYQAFNVGLTAAGLMTPWNNPGNGDITASAGGHAPHANDAQTTQQMLIKYYEALGSPRFYANKHGFPRPWLVEAIDVDELVRRGQLKMPSETIALERAYVRAQIQNQCCFTLFRDFIGKGPIGVAELRQPDSDPTSYELIDWADTTRSFGDSVMLQYTCEMLATIMDWQADGVDAKGVPLYKLVAHDPNTSITLGNGAYQVTVSGPGLANVVDSPTAVEASIQTRFDAQYTSTVADSVFGAGHGKAPVVKQVFPEWLVSGSNACCSILTLMALSALNPLAAPLMKAHQGASTGKQTLVPKLYPQGITDQGLKLQSASGVVDAGFNGVYGLLRGMWDTTLVDIGATSVTSDAMKPTLDCIRRDPDYLMLLLSGFEQTANTDPANV
jgi:hypothetical protein